MKLWKKKISKTKLALYAGGGVATILLGRWAARAIRERWGSQKQLAGPEASIAYTVRIPSLSAAVAKQIAKATAGEPLKDHTKALDNAKFWGAPPTNVDAYLTAAYWLAVASRVSGDRSLAASAYARGSKGGLLFAMPGSSLLTGSVREIMSDAAATLRASAGASKAAGILAILDQHSSEGAIKAVQDRVKDKEVIRNTVVASTQDTVTLAAKGSLLIRDGLGLNRPDGSTPPWWRVWIVRGGVVAVALIGARVAFGAQYMMAKHALGTVVSKAKEAHAEITDRSAA